MADDDTTQFRFNFGGIKLELSGDRQFVERMYQQVMEDVEEARDRHQSQRSTKPAGSTDEDEDSIWIHRCSDMMRKIYMIPRRDLAPSMLNRVVDSKSVENIYVEKTAFQNLFPHLKDGHTLWAEFTSVGKEKIAEATEPAREALQIPKSQL